MNVKVIVEIPKNCEECPFSYLTEGMYCNYCRLKALDGTNPFEAEICDYMIGEKRPEWCPLDECKRVVLYD